MCYAVCSANEKLSDCALRTAWSIKSKPPSFRILVNTPRFSEIFRCVYVIVKDSIKLRKA